MRKSILWALGVAAIVVVAGVAAYLFLYEGTVSIYVKDAPADWLHVNVTFKGVSIHESRAAQNDGWHNFTLHEQTIDLLNAGSVGALLAEGKVGPGNYTQLRIDVIRANGEMADGTPVTFNVPSGELKTTTPFTVRSGAATTLTLDIDLSRSIVEDGSSWIFTPVLGSFTTSP